MLKYNDNIPTLPSPGGADDDDDLGTVGDNTGPSMSDATISDWAPAAGKAEQQPNPRTGSHTPPGPGNCPKKPNGPAPPAHSRRPIIDGVPWTPSDRPLFQLRARWHLATDDELQWILYRRRGSQWQAISFPTARISLLRVLRDRVSTKSGTYTGIDQDALAAVQAFPDHFRTWKQQQTAAPATGA